MKDLNLETQRAQCSNNRMMCHFTALWDRITASDVADGGYTQGCASIIQFQKFLAINSSDYSILIIPRNNTTNRRIKESRNY